MHLVTSSFLLLVVMPLFLMHLVASSFLLLEVLLLFLVVMPFILVNSDAPCY